MNGQKALRITIDDEGYITRQDIDKALKRIRKLGYTYSFSSAFIEIITNTDPNAKEKVLFD